MSFSSEQKYKIISDQYKNPCCRKALLCGVLSAKGYIDGDTVCLTLEKEDFCEFLAKLISEFYSAESKIESPPKGGRCKFLSFRSKAAIKYLRSVSTSESLFSQKCQGCSQAYAKGLFLASGNISDPKKQYLFELSPSFNFDLILEFLRDRSFFPKTTERNGKKVAYIKKASEIEDICGFLGLTDAMFEITNTQIEREFLNNTNRVVNCETNNIEKSVSASGKQLEAINVLNEYNLLSSLPEELEYTARLRLQNESLSLSQLSKLFTPPISKSGLSHRLTKIIEIADQLLKGKG